MGEKQHAQLQAWADVGSASEQTQNTLVTLWGASQGSVSDAFDEFIRRGYVRAQPRIGKQVTPYVLAGVSRLIFG